MYINVKYDNNELLSTYIFPILWKNVNNILVFADTVVFQSTRIIIYILYFTMQFFLYAILMRFGKCLDV
jgi:hypothetical protein